MKFLWLFLAFLSATNAVRHVITVDPHDPVPEDNDADLWRVLYSKLNFLLDEARELKESILHIKTRQQVQGHDIAELLENQRTNKQCLTESMDIKTPDQNPEWIVFLRRQDGSVDFQRNWTDYKHGFGDPNGEFFMGLEKLHAMTTHGAPPELLIILKDWENEKRHAAYDLFQIGSEAEQYAIKELGSYSGDAGDALSYHSGMKFSTLDNSNSGLCPTNYGGGWWFSGCVDSNLHSVYRQRDEYTDLKKILWNTWKGWNYSLKFAEMKIRAKV